MHVKAPRAAVDRGHSAVSGDEVRRGVDARPPRVVQSPRRDQLRLDNAVGHAALAALARSEANAEARSSVERAARQGCVPP